MRPGKLSRLPAVDADGAQSPRKASDAGSSSRSKASPDRLTQAAGMRSPPALLLRLGGLVVVALLLYSASSFKLQPAPPQVAFLNRDPQEAAPAPVPHVPSHDNGRIVAKKGGRPPSSVRVPERNSESPNRKERWSNKRDTERFRQLPPGGFPGTSAGTERKERSGGTRPALSHHDLMQRFLEGADNLTEDEEDALIVEFVTKMVNAVPADVRRIKSHFGRGRLSQGARETGRGGGIVWTGKRRTAARVLGINETLLLRDLPVVPLTFLPPGATASSEPITRQSLAPAASPTWFGSAVNVYPPTPSPCNSPPPLCPTFAPCNASSLPGVNFCTVPEFTDVTDEQPREIFGCPMERDGQGAVLAYNSSCMHAWDTETLKATSQQLFRFHRVVVSSHGVVFSTTHHFHQRLCTEIFPEQYALPPNMTVFEIKTPFLLWHHDFACCNFYHFLKDALPALVTGLLALNGTKPRLYAMASVRQWQWYDRLGVPLLGSTSLRRLYTPLDDAAVYGHTVYQPSFHLCRSPSRAFWSFFRAHHLLPPPPLGLPVFHANLTWRSTQRMSDSEMAAIPPDWRVVVFERALDSRGIVQATALRQLLTDMFGKMRLVRVSAPRNIMAARNVFRRARLFVSPHGAGLTNMVFMPLNATVFEIRPRLWDAACYRQLAMACSLTYYLSIGEGNKTTPLHINIHHVKMVLLEIKRRFKREDNGLDLIYARSLWFLPDCGAKTFRCKGNSSMCNMKTSEGSTNHHGIYRCVVFSMKEYYILFYYRMNSSVREFICAFAIHLHLVLAFPHPFPHVLCKRCWAWNRSSETRHRDPIFGFLSDLHNRTTVYSWTVVFA